jgi:hypothetical protein
MFRNGMIDTFGGDGQNFFGKLPLYLVKLLFDGFTIGLGKKYRVF